MHLLGMPEKYATERGGWKTDETTKKVYQNVFTAERKAIDSRINAYFEQIIALQTRGYITRDITCIEKPP